MDEQVYLTGQALALTITFGSSSIARADMLSGALRDIEYQIMRIDVLGVGEQL